MYDGRDENERRELEELMRAHFALSAKDICSAVLAYASRRDQQFRDSGESDLVDDKTVFVIKRSNPESASNQPADVQGTIAFNYNNGGLGPVPLPGLRR